MTGHRGARSPGAASAAAAAAPGACSPGSGLPARGPSSNGACWYQRRVLEPCRCLQEGAGNKRSAVWRRQPRAAGLAQPRRNEADVGEGPQAEVARPAPWESQLQAVGRRSRSLPTICRASSNRWARGPPVHGAVQRGAYAWVAVVADARVDFMNGDDSAAPSSSKVASIKAAVLWRAAVRLVGTGRAPEPAGSPVAVEELV